MCACRENVHSRNYAAVSTRLRGATGVMEEFSRYQSIPQVKQLLDRWVWGLEKLFYWALV